MGRKRTRRMAALAGRPGETPRPAAPSACRPGRREWLIVLLLFAAVWVVTANGLGGAFILDDESKIVTNTDLRQWDGLASRLIYPYEENRVLARNDPSRPLVFLIDGVLYHFFGLSPVPYHAVNAVLHFASAALVFLLVQVMLWHLVGARKLLAPVLVAGLFLVTPIQVGTVIYAYALNDVLSSVLMLASLYCFVRVPVPRALDVAASGAALVLALSAKQSAVVAPLLILAFDFFILSRMDVAALKARLRFHVPLLALVAAYLAFRLAYFGALGDIEGRGNTQPALTYFLTQPTVILRYLFSSLIPYHLAIDHYFLPADIGAAATALSFLVLGAGVLGGVFLFWRAGTPVARYGLFAIFLYAIVLVPTSSVLATVDIMVERRVYLANVGLFMLVVLAWDALGHVALFSGVAKRVTVGLICLQVAALAGVSISRNRIYSTNEGAWLDILRIYPESVRAINNLGNRYLDAKQYDKAKDCFERLVARNPKDYIAQQNLGAIHEREDSPFHDADKAIAFFTASVTSNPDFAEGYYNLGRLEQKLAQARGDASLAEAALACYKRVLELNPTHVLAHNNLGLLYFHAGKTDAARKEYETALRLDPACRPAAANLKLLDAPRPGPAGTTFESTDQVPRELLIRLYEQALGRDPKNQQIRQKYDELMRKPQP
jgi:protein O-mannosyl-transferase